MDCVLKLETEFEAYIPHITIGIGLYDNNRLFFLIRKRNLKWIKVDKLFKKNILGMNVVTGLPSPTTQ